MIDLGSNFQSRTASTRSGGGGGGGAYGGVPGAVGVPANTFTQLGSVLPNLSNLTGGASNVVGAELGGGLSPNTMNALKSAAATFGISSGMGPGSGLENNQLFGNIAGFSEHQQHQGLQDYLGLTSGLGREMTDPGLAYQVADRNSVYAAAPDPAAAAKNSLDLYDKYYNRGSGAAGSTSNLPWWAQGRGLAGGLGTGTTMTAPGVFHTPAQI